MYKYYNQSTPHTNLHRDYALLHFVLGQVLKVVKNILHKFQELLNNEGKENKKHKRTV